MEQSSESLQQVPMSAQLVARRVVDLLVYDLHGSLAVSRNNAVEMAGAEVVKHSVDGYQLCSQDCVRGPIAAWCNSQFDFPTSAVYA